MWGPVGHEGGVPLGVSVGYRLGGERIGPKGSIGSGGAGGVRCYQRTGVNRSACGGVGGGEGGGLCRQLAHLGRLPVGEGHGP